MHFITRVSVCLSVSCSATTQRPLIGQTHGSLVCRSALLTSVMMMVCRYISVMQALKRHLTLRNCANVCCQSI